MKRLLTMPSWAIFFLTVGMPIIGLLLGLAVSFVIDPSSLVRVIFPEDFMSAGLISGWLLGLLIHLTWVLFSGYSLYPHNSVTPWVKWLALILGLIALSILCYLAKELLYLAIFVPVVKASEVTPGLSYQHSLGERRLYILLVLGTWFTPRFAIYAINSWLLVHVEGHKHWLSTFILFALWPIGIWFLQPRVRKVFRAPKERNISEHLI